MGQVGLRLQGGWPINIRSVVPLPATSLVGSISTPLYSIRSTQMASDLQQMPLQNKPSPPGYRHVTLNSFYAGIQALVSQWAKRLNVKG